MADVKKKIMEDALKRFVRNRGEHADPAMYFESTVLPKGATLEVPGTTVEVEEPTNYVFVDEQPGFNWGHGCQYILYNAESGKHSKTVNAKFPPFLNDSPSETTEAFRSPVLAERYRRTRPMRMALEPARLSSYATLARLPFRLRREGRRFAILFSGSSNCRHVNDFEFLYRTLLDVYAFNPGDIYVCNYDGNVNWSQACWGTFCEPAQNLASPIAWPVDNTPFRLQVDEPGTRAGFQNVIGNVANDIGADDCLFVFTNNHGWFGKRPSGPQDEGYLSTWSGGDYWAGDFAADLQTLPRFKTLLVVMEQCSSGSFIQPVMGSTPADRTVVQTAVPAKESSAGGWFFDPWIELWISAAAGVRGDGSALAVSPDDDLDSRISAWEAYDFASSQDNPRMQESSPDLSRHIYLRSCDSYVKVKEIKEFKEFKEYKETKEKDIKEFKEKELKEIKEVKEGAKDFKDSKEAKETKEWDAKGAGDYLDVRPPDEMVVRPGEGLEERPGTLEWVRTLEGRVAGLEHAINRLTPFIRSELRPDVRGAAFDEDK